MGLSPFQRNGPPPRQAASLPAILLFAAAVMLVLDAPALAAESKAGSTEAVLIGEIVLLIVAGRLIGEVMLRLGQPAVMGQLMAGILLGPSVLGWLWPEAQHFLFPKSAEQKAMLDGIAQFGILLLLLLAGMETELSLVRDVRRAAISASIAGITLPFICGLALGYFLPEALLPDPQKRLVTALFFGTALSISSVKIVASVVRDMGFMRRNVGQVILASAIVDDTIGWIIIAITFGLAGQASFSWMSVGANVIGTFLFLGFSFTIGRRLVFRLIQFTNDHFRGEAPVIATILVVMGAFALITQLIGVHTVLGAFIAGILIGESPILTEEIDRQLRGIVAGLFMPVFFGLAGLTADLTVLKDKELALLTVALVAIASFGKAIGAFAGGWFGGLSNRESTALAMGMNARGSTEVIVATIGLSMGVLSQNLFTMIVAMALVTTIAMPPTLRWALHRLPMRREEKQRLEREEYERSAFVPNIERILLAIDASTNAQFATRIAGLLAGSRGMPVTILTLDAGAHKQASKGPAKRAEAEAEAERDREAAEIVRRAADRIGEKPSDKPKVDVIVRKHDVAPEEAIAQEARRGYDLLVIGIEHVAAPRGGFHEDLSRLVGKFEGSLAVVAARGAFERDPAAPIENILTPVTGNENSRRGAEVAVTLASSAQARISALSVTSPETRQQQRLRREAKAVADEIERIAKQLDTKVRMITRTERAPEDAILHTVERGRHDLVVMGVSRRPGDALSFGSVAETLIKSVPCSLVLVAPQMRGATKSATKGPDEAAAG
jgi:Kef-type K+ transport system membrane component KefB/nucleotide-binding universal stress UspA family protein